LCFLVLAGVQLWAQNPIELQAFAAAARSFEDGFFQRAERELGEFVQKFPASERVAEAVLLQAQSRYELGQHEGVIELLTHRLAAAGSWADRYRFWIAEAKFARGDYAGAADGYAQLLKDYPASARRLEASYAEAHARFKLGEVQATIDLLRQPAGAFQQAAQGRPEDEFVTRGQLLLAEALLALKDAAAAEQTLTALAPRALPAELHWHRQHLLTRALLTGQKLQAALQIVTNLTSLGASPARQAEATALHGEILEQFKQPVAAIQVYEKNLADTAPPDRRRQAVLKIVELSLAQQQLAPAIQRLEAFLQSNPQDPTLDLVRLSLGELRLKEYFTLAADAPAAGAGTTQAARTNLLQQAQAQFDQFIAAFPQSPLLGKAHLNRGWCLWEQGKVSEAALAFKEATERLPPSEDQGRARFKWAECQLLQADYPSAVANLRAVIELGRSVPALKTNLVDQALYQIARAGVAAGNLADATPALDTLLAEHPGSPLSERAVLLVGQGLSQAGRTSEARQRFADFAARFPDCALLPEVLLASARTFVHEGKWTNAIGEYDTWVARFTNHPALPRAEFDRAWFHSQAGQETHAFALLTSFVTRFPTNELAPPAQFWIGRYHFDRGDYPLAEASFQLLYQNTNWPPGELSFQARMMAGRAALARQAPKDARDYFRAVITNGPPSLAPEALFALGDTFIEEAEEPSTNILSETYGQAINAFSRLTNNFPQHRLTLLAVGRIGDCHFQLATQEPRRYDSAAECYQIVANSTAEIGLRSLAQIGLGVVSEAQAQTKTNSPAERAALQERALDHYLNVVYGKNLRADETLDPLQVKEAGVRAARLLKSQQRWAEASRLYSRLKELLPPLRAALEAQEAQARAQAEAPTDSGGRK
jgi:TolA-binding protein